MKADLLRVLPKENRELLLWHSTDTGVTFARFRDTVVNQTAQMLMNRSARSVNTVDAVEGSSDYKKILKKLGEGIGEEEELLDDLCASIVARRGRGGQQDGRRGDPPQRSNNEPRPPAKQAGRLSSAPTVGTRTPPLSALNRQLSSLCGRAGTAGKLATVPAAVPRPKR